MKKNLVMFLSLILFTLAAPAVTVLAADSKATDVKVVDTKTDIIYDGVGIYQNSMPSVVHITYPGSGGSGFFIDKNLIVTNYHVLEDIKTNIDIVDMYDNHYTVKYVLGYNKTTDIALIQVNEAGVSYLKRNTHEVLHGSLVYTLGNPYGIPFVIAQGLVGKPSWNIEGKDTIMHTAPMSAGNSGGPLVNQYGEVLGINTLSSGGTDAQNLNYAVKIDEVDNVDISHPVTFNQFLNRFNVEHKVVDKSKAKIGDIVVMGKYEQDNNMNNGTEDIEWLVISEKNNELLVLSNYCLDVSCWNKDNKQVTWKDSEYRKFLTSFYESAFTSTEKRSIMKVNTDKEFTNRPEYTINRNLFNEETYDYVFIPSTSELSAMYFHLNNGLENQLRCAEATEYCKTKNAASWKGSEYTFYATRCIEKIAKDERNCITIGVYGEFTLDSANSIGECGNITVRPAMWIKKR